MSAPYGNINAKKWTEEKVIEVLEDMKKDVEVNKHTIHISIVMANAGLYCEIWTYWKRVFKDHQEISDRIAYIDGLIHCKLQHGALHGEIDPVVAKFAMANSYQWVPYKEECKDCLPPKLRNYEEAYIVGEDGTPKYIKDHKMFDGKKGGFDHVVRFPDDSKKKWTDEEVMGYLQQLTPENYETDIWTAEMAMVKIGMHKGIWDTWYENYGGEIQQYMKNIEAFFYSKLLRAISFRQVNRSMGLYMLKRIYKWEAEPKPEMGDYNEIKGTFINAPRGLFLIGGY